MATLTETPHDNGETVRPTLRPLVGLTPEMVARLPEEKLDGLLETLLNKF